MTGEETLLKQILPLVKKYESALVLLASDASGIPVLAKKRLEIIGRMVEEALSVGIPIKRLIVDCVAESCAVNTEAVQTTLDTMKGVREQWSLNLLLGASNVSFGLPCRTVINAVFLSLAIQAGLTSAIVNAKQMKPYIMAADLLLGHDHRARRYTGYCRTLFKPLNRPGDPS